MAEMHFILIRNFAHMCYNVAAEYFSEATVHLICFITLFARETLSFFPSYYLCNILPLKTNYIIPCLCVCLSLSVCVCVGVSARA